MARQRSQSLQHTQPNFILTARKMSFYETSSFMRKCQVITQSSKKQLVYSISKGNNSELIQKSLEKRKNWGPVQQTGQWLNFRWLQSDRCFKYEQLMDGMKQMVNYVQNHQQLTFKGNLIRNLTKYCYLQKAYLWEITPVSFVLDFDNKFECDRIMKEFREFHQKCNPQYRKKKEKTYRIQQLCSIKKENKYTKPKLNESFIVETENIWILKPSHFNRGRGIQLFCTLSELQNQLDKFQSGVSDYKFDQNNLQKNNNNNNNTTLIKSREFVIQKYMSKPFLIEGRKFDIRIWVLLGPDLDMYMFEQGYLRLSSEQFNLSDLNTFIHLTNNAVQKHCKNYGQFELGNQMSFQQFNEYTEYQFEQKTLGKIKQIIVISGMSVGRDLKRNQNCFQILGYDFMLDYQLKPWLIEINSNPCLDESSPLLQKLLPKMIDDALTIVIDKKQNQQNQWEHLIQL